MPLRTSPRDPHQRPEPFIRPGDLNKGRAGPEDRGPEFEDLAPSLPAPPGDHNPSRPQLERSGEKARGWPLFPTKDEGTGNRGASPLGLSGKQQPAEAVA